LEIESSCAAASKGYRDVWEWLTSHMAAQLGVSAGEIDPRRPFAAYGLTSELAVGIAVQLGEFLDRELEATLLWDYPSLNKLMSYLVETLGLETEVI